MRVIISNAQRRLLRRKAKELGISMTPSAFAQAREIIMSNRPVQVTGDGMRSHLPEMCKEMKIMDLAVHIFALISIAKPPLAIAAE